MIFGKIVLPYIDNYRKVLIKWTNHNGSPFEASFEITREIVR